MYSVYLHQNKVNGKRYIGITSVEPRVRWKKGYGYSEDLPIGRAIRKYGWDGFTHEILYSCLTEEEAKQVEIDLIKKYRTQDRAYGYNICAGGDGVKGWHPSEETRRKMSDSAKKRVGEKNPNFGNRWTDEMKNASSVLHRRENLSEETLRKMSESAKDRNGKKNPFYGKHHTEDTKRLLSKMRSRPVDMFDRDMNYIRSFPSIKCAAEETGIHKVSISNCCRGASKTSGGYVWKYKEN